jgi:predicted NACHT family NTPase
VLKAIESQHGLLTERAKDIYSFSHLTFHEYFTAKNILGTSDSDTQQMALQRLAEHVTKKRWREVFLLVAERIENAEYLLKIMLEKIKASVKADEDLQRFLGWVNEKSASVGTSYKAAAVSAFYLDLARARDRSDLDLALDLDFAPDLARNINLDRVLNFALDLALNHNYDFDRTRTLNRAINRAINFDCAHDSKLQQNLQALREELQSKLQDKELFKQWSDAHRKTWVEQFRHTIIKHRNIGHNWQFSREPRSRLRQHYGAFRNYPSPRENPG